MTEEDSLSEAMNHEIRLSPRGGVVEQCQPRAEQSGEV